MKKILGNTILDKETQIELLFFIKSVQESDVFNDVLKAQCEYLRSKVKGD